MKRSAPLQRKTRLRARRPTPRTHKLVPRLTGKALSELRWQCWNRDNGCCQDCGVRVYFEARFDGDPDAYDMAHRRNKRMHGDTLDNVVTKCHRCHMQEHAKGRA